ncbi:MAG TPA: hypothetical protein VIY27_04705, partial [Myxococcota bacterium]
AGCGGGPVAPQPDPAYGLEAVGAPSIRAFYQQATIFYAQLEGRRFNSLVTFRDPALRAFFRSEQAFSDYYADLAQALTDAHFDKSRPFGVRVEEFLFEDERTALVQVRFRGWDGRPLRPGATDLVRLDRWDWVDGTWWLHPGKL